MSEIMTAKNLSLWYGENQALKNINITVPDTFLAMDEVPILDHTMLGNGFMVADQVPYLTAYETVMQKCDSVQKQTWYMGFDGQGFYYWLCSCFFYL